MTVSFIGQYMAELDMQVLAWEMLEVSQLPRKSLSLEETPQVCSFQL